MVSHMYLADVIAIVADVITTLLLADILTI